MEIITRLKKMKWSHGFNLCVCSEVLDFLIGLVQKYQTCGVVKLRTMLKIRFKLGIPYWEVGSLGYLKVTFLLLFSIGLVHIVTGKKSEMIQLLENPG